VVTKRISSRACSRARTCRQVARARMASSCGWSTAPQHRRNPMPTGSPAGDPMRGIMRLEPAYLFDLDGTLVDSVYQHVLAWKEALDAEGIELSVWRIHRKIGMSGGLFTNQLLRETELDISEERVNRLRRNHAEAYRQYADQVRPLPGARDLLAW